MGASGAHFRGSQRIFTFRHGASGDGRNAASRRALRGSVRRSYAERVIEPLTLRPEYSNAMWGGRKLGHLPGAPAEGPIAEAWLVSDLKSRPSRVARGPHEGATLREVIAACGGDLLGLRAAQYREFPLLIKAIDARLPLSVQVHPDDRLAREMAGTSYGKTEAWVVLQADPGSRIFAGLKPGVGPDDLRRALEANRVEDLLYSFEPRIGDTVFIRAGTVHALGAGIAIFEVQQTSDVTYRLFDWDRVDPSTGRPRQLHVEEALRCIDYNLGPVNPARGDRVECDYFRVAVHRQSVTLGGDGQPRVLVSYLGRTTGCIDVYPEGAVVVPASFGECRLTPEPGAWLFEVVML